VAGGYSRNTEEGNVRRCSRYQASASEAVTVDTNVCVRVKYKAQSRAASKSLMSIVTLTRDNIIGDIILHLPEGTEEKHERIQSEIWSRGQTS
jgi:hypothetical protein